MKYQLPNDSEKAQYVQQKFDEIAPKYDLFNDLITFGMHRYWKLFMVRQTGLSENGVCLDLCCGTGDIARRLCHAVPSGRVYALDFSREMLKCAQSSLTEKFPSLTLLQGDAMKLPFGAKTLDAITIGYGLRNVHDLPLCLKEILRVLKPGGVLVSLDVGKVRLPIISTLSQFFFFHIVPWIGKRLYPGQEMFDYLPHSSINYPNQEALKKMMLHSGFKQVDIHDFVFGASTIQVAYKP